MELGVDGFQVVPGDVGINLSGGDVGVAEELLHDPQIGAPLQEVRRKRMAKRVRRDFLPDAGGTGVLAYELPAPWAGQRFPGTARKQESADWKLAPDFREVRAPRPDRRPAERDNSFFAALAPAF